MAVRLLYLGTKDAGTTGAAGAVAPVAFCLDNFTGALYTGAQQGCSAYSVNP